MADNGEIIGLTLCKINGMYRVDVKNARWSVKKATPQFVTGAGVQTALGEEMPSGSFDEVIARKPFDWRALKFFSIEIFDKETKSIVVFAAEGCNWGNIDGSSDLQSATTGKSIGWVGKKPTTI